MQWWRLLQLAIVCSNVQYGNGRVWRCAAACGVQRAAGVVRQGASGGGNNGDGNTQAAAACGNVQLFSSCGDSNVIQYLMLNFAFFVPGALEMARGKKQD